MWATANLRALSSNLIQPEGFHYINIERERRITFNKPRITLQAKEFLHLYGVDTATIPKLIKTKFN